MAVSFRQRCLSMADAASIEAMRYWADVGDNRFSPIMNELAEAILDEEDPTKLTKIANRLKFMSSSVLSHRDRLQQPK